MDILKMIAGLRAERQRIEEAILVIERLASGGRGRRRGRPPKWMSAATSEAAEAATFSTKRKVSAAARQKMADAQKRRWAAAKFEKTSS